MSDLYSVLKQSILDRRLRTAPARREVYAQARTAVIRQLWTYDPPLSETEIEDRVGEFDHAVEMIESDVARIFAETSSLASSQSNQRPPAPRHAPVLEGYDEATDYTPAVAARSGQQNRNPRDDRESERPTARRDTRSRRPIISEIEQALARPDTDARDALSERHEDPGIRDEPEPDHRSLPKPDEQSYDDPERYWQSRQAEAYDHAEADVDPASYDEGGYAAQANEDDDPYEEAGLPARFRWNWRDLSERHRIIALLSAIGALVVVLLILAVVLLFSSSTPTTSGSADTISVNPPANPSGPSVNPSKVVGTFVVFDGRDPTVFQTGPGNPIHFEGAASGGFARISSSTSDPGVRVMIGPGLADRLAGHSIRLTVVARSAHDNGAADLRFAYQSGVALSPWQAANLKADFVTEDLTWRVPTQRTDPDGDYILIEPGIPGDGTGADISAIRIDLLG